MNIPLPMIPLKLADGGPYPTTVPARTKQVYLVAAHGRRYTLAPVELTCPEIILFSRVQTTKYRIMISITL